MKSGSASSKSADIHSLTPSETSPGPPNDPDKATVKMSSSILPHLLYLKATFGNLAASTRKDPIVELQIRTARRLLDYMMTQISAASGLRKECYAELQAILPQVESEVGPQAELKAFCSSAPERLDDFLRLLGNLQRQLIDRSTPAARQLSQALASIEAEYNRKFAAAVEELSAASDQAVASAMRNARAYDEKALADFIRRAFPREPDVTIAESAFVSGGYSKFTLRIALENTRSLPKHLILRADASATFGGASVTDEYRLIKTLYAHGVRVPQPIAVEETGSVFGSKFMLVEQAPGISIGHMYKLPARNAAVCRDVAQQLAAMHRIPVAAFGELDHRSGRSSDKALAWIEEGVAAWTPLEMPSPCFTLAFEWLRRNAKLNDRAPRALVHGDVHLANMLVHENRISAILDWEFAHIGNPAYDLGYFYDQAVALDSWEEFLKSYGEAGGIVPDQAQLDYAILFAATRLGVMTCQSMNEFTAGINPALAGAVVVGDLFYETTITRINKALQRVL